MSRLKKNKGFVSITIIITMFFVLSIAASSYISTSGLMGNYKETLKIEENQGMGENFVYFYRAFITEEIKKIYVNTPKNEKYLEDKLDKELMRKNCLREIYAYLRISGNSEFRNRIRAEDLRGYLNYKLDRYTMMVGEYYKTSTRKFESYSGLVDNDDFRVNMQFSIIKENGKKVTVNSQVYFKIPTYTEEDMNTWLSGEDIYLDEEMFKVDVITRLGEVRTIE